MNEKIKKQSNSSKISPDRELDFLIGELCRENLANQRMALPETNDQKRQLLRKLMNVRPPGPVSPEFLEIQDRLLQREVRDKGVVTAAEIKTVNAIRKEAGLKGISFGEQLSLWQGDITRLGVDAIVNAANSQLLGCFVPGHNCIDNVIHSAAGVQLREACFELMREQQTPEPTGQARITPAYNLPARYVIHTVGPIVSAGLTPQLEADLKNCYQACLETALANQVRTLAFCCIATGVFCFPNQRAAEIAIETVKTFLNDHQDAFDRIIFNVFLDIEFTIYEKLFENE